MYENLSFLQSRQLAIHSSDAASGWAGWALPHPEFGVSVNPIPTRGADYAHCITACPTGFENLAASLHSDNIWANSATKITLKFLTTCSADLPNRPKYLGY